MRLMIAAVVSTLLACSVHAQRVEEWVTGLNKPVDAAFDPTNSDRLFVVDQDGWVAVIEDGELLDEKFIEVDPDNFTGRVGKNSNWERGLLGIAFDPGYAENGRLYLYYTDAEGATVTSRFVASGSGPGPRTADWSTETPLLRIEQPYRNHNGGCIRFGPDGMLYIGPGDGGAANDPQGYGQRLDTLLGKLLRIDVTGEPDEGLAYAVPADNPFVGREGVRPEIWAYGLRNAWRFEFDSLGRLWIADVGQNRYEEVHVQRAGSTGGENYGWKDMEGFGEFKAGTKKRDDPPRLEPSAHVERGFEPPVFEYRHHPVASITGGYFYEGESLGWLRNRYICADFMSGRVWSFRARERGGVLRADDIAEHTAGFRATFGGKGTNIAISGFVLSPDGEDLYVLDHSAGRVLRVTE